MNKAILELKRVSTEFGGVTAVDNVNLAVEPGELSSIIGPNGAGKTTLFHTVSGYYRCKKQGSVLFNGEDISDLPPYKINRMGISRSFQVLDIFPQLSVFKNVQIALIAHQGRTFTIFASAEGLFRDEVMDILKTVGLNGRAQQIGGSLSRGDQKCLELAIALACRPKLLLLDEPTAGMSSTERQSTVELVKKLNREQGITILFIEHHIDVVLGISNRIWVMNQGKVIAEGTPEQISNNDYVRKVYFGETA